MAIEIRDTGRGVDPAIRHRIFDPFFTTKPVGQGTGLGLSICHGIVTALGGDIELDSTPGEGTTVTVRLLAAGTEGARRPSEPDVELSSGRPRVLIVDDEKVVARALARALAEEGDVSVASSGLEALELCDERSFDHVLCDLMMPEMTGMDLYDRLSEERPGLAQRMVFMTGGAFTPRAREFLERVDNPRMDKPVPLPELRGMIRGARGTS